jgi:voltage-gated potassium channel
MGALLPLDHTARWLAIATLVIGLVALIGLIASQVRAIIASPFRPAGASRPLSTLCALVFRRVVCTVMRRQALGSIPIGGSADLQVEGLFSHVATITNSGPWTE